MSAQRLPYALAVMVLALTAACSQPAAETKAPEPPADGCVAGAVKNTEGGFCLVPPPAAKALPPSNSDANNRNYGFFDATGKGVNVDVSKLDDIMTWEWTVKAYDRLQAAADRSQQQSGDLPGGGRLYSYVQGNHARTDVITHKGNTLLTCNTAGSELQPDQLAVDACKSLRPL